MTDEHFEQKKGAALFAKRKQKADKWIVDENSVKQRASNPAPEPVASAPAPVNTRAEQSQKIASVQVCAADVSNCVRLPDCLIAASGIFRRLSVALV